MKRPSIRLVNPTVELSVALICHAKLGKKRISFPSDEDYAAYLQDVADYEAHVQTLTWTTHRSPSQWTPADVDRLIARAAAVLDALPNHGDRLTFYETKPGPGSVGQVAIRHLNEKRRGRSYFSNDITVTSCRAPWTASIRLPEPIPATTIAALLEVHGHADFVFTLALDGDAAERCYTPVHHLKDPQDIRHGGTA